MMKKSNYPLNEHPHITSLKQLVYMQAENKPNHAAFQYMLNKKIVTVTYDNFKTDIELLGTYFYSEGIRDKKIALIGENSYEWILTYFAAVIGSNIIVPIDKELSESDICDLASRCNADILIYSDVYSDIATAAQNKNIISKILNMNDFPLFLQKGAELLGNGFNDFINNKIDENAVCSIIFTSGTTGKPKGVMLSQKNLATDVVGSCENVYIAGSSLLTLPLHHTFAFSTSVLAMMFYGVTIFINKSLRTFTKDMQTFKPQNMFVVPLYVETMYKRIWQTAEEQGKDKLLKRIITVSNILRKFRIDIRQKLFKSVLVGFGGNLNLIVSGGAAIDKKYIKAFDDIGILVLNGYGITECSPVVAVNRNEYYKAETVGLPLPCCDVKMVAGEICVKGDNVMLGYYEDEEANKEAFYDEYFRTGDLGYLDNDGFLHITGRKKNLIILSNGKNVSPEELEEKILNIPNVIEAVAYGKEDIIAVDIYAENTDNIQAAITELNKTLPMYKQIQKVYFRDTEFDKTTTKKIIRRDYHAVED